MQNDRKITLALIYGGRGCEREVSIRGKKNICSLIDEDTYSLLPVFIDEGGRWLIDKNEVFPFSGGFYCPKEQGHYLVDAAFPLLHGDFGEDGKVQGALECADIPYVGCDVSAGAVCRDKAFVKIIAESLNIPTLPHLLLLCEEGSDYAARRIESEIGYPVFIKPARLGSSVGVGYADHREKLLFILKNTFKLTDRVIAEPMLLCKRELECGYFGVKGKEIFTNPGEILIDGTYGYEEKYIDSHIKVVTRADVDQTVSQNIREYSRRLVRALGVRDISRIDFFLSEGRLYFNEINTMPGFTEGSLYPRMIEGAGIGTAEMLDRLVRSCISRT